MDLKEVFHIARSLKDYDDFKAFIDQEFNGTPTTVVDNTQYELVTLGLPPVVCSHESYAYTLNNYAKICDDCDALFE